MYRGAYHFAQPHESSGKEQADFFVRNGGNWIKDGRTLPGVLDVEDNPYNNRNGLNSCYGLDQDEMVTWIGDWLSRYKAWTKRDAIIYTTTSWWKTCTGDTKKFAKNPLWIARWGSDPGELPAAWKKWTFWQKAEKADHAGGSDAFNGSLSQLHALADPPVRHPDLGGAKSRSQYVLKISNTGAKLATKINISGKTFGNNRLTYAPKACKRTATTVKCTINSLAPGKSATFKFSTKPRGTKPVGINFLVGPDQGDPQVTSEACCGSMTPVTGSWSRSFRPVRARCACTSTPPTCAPPCWPIWSGGCWSGRASGWPPSRAPSTTSRRCAPTPWPSASGPSTTSPFRPARSTC